MQVTNNFSSLNRFSTNTYSPKQQIEKNSYENISDVTNTDSNNSPSSLVMTLEEIQQYLEDNGIDDENGNRAKDLFSLQEFIGKVDDETYTRMFDALNEEKNTSYSSMRYSSYPSSEMLDENPKMFHAIIETTLNMEDTAHALIFTLDLKKILSNEAKDNNSTGITSTNKPPSLDLDIDFEMMTLIGFLKKKMEELDESGKDGLDLSEQNFLNDYAALLGNYQNFEERTVTSNVDILV